MQNLKRFSLWTTRTLKISDLNLTQCDRSHALRGNESTLLNLGKEKIKKKMIKMLLTLLLLSVSFILWSAFGAEEKDFEIIIVSMLLPSSCRNQKARGLHSSSL